MKYQIGNILQKKGYLNKNKLAIAMTGKLFNISTVQTGFEFETGSFFLQRIQNFTHIGRENINCFGLLWEK